MEKSQQSEARAFLEYNSKISERERHNPRHKKFLEWCFRNGLKWTGIDFPAYFGENGVLRGVVATRDIKPYELVLAVPNKLLMTTMKAREDKYLGKMFKAEEDMFYDEDNGEYNCLIAYLMREKQKGEESFWAPFINLVPEIQTGLVWDQETIEFIQCPALRQEVKEAQDDFNDEWRAMKSTLSKYPNMFGK